MKIAIQGQAGSFMDIAAKTFYQDKYEPVYCETFETMFSALDKDEVEACVCAIENTLYGTVIPAYEQLVKHHFWVAGEVYLPIHHQLIGLPGAKIEDLKEVHTQAPAFGQCEKYLDSRLAHVERVEEHDTAGSVELIKKWNDPTKAAIASLQAAEKYGLPILARNIEDYSHNATRFLVLTKKEVPNKNANKTSLTLTTPHHAGALYNALGAFAKHDINLSRLIARQIPHDPWKYMFYIDIEAGVHTPEVEAAYKELEAQGCKVLTLGTYERGDQLD